MRHETKPVANEGPLNEALAQGQVRVFESMALGAPLSEVLNAILLVCEAQFPQTLGSILLLDAQGCLRHGAARQLPEAYSQAINGLSIGAEAGSCGTAAFRGEAVVVENIETDPLWARYKHLALAHGLRACWSTPIFDAERKVLGTFAMYSREPGRPNPRHLQVIGVITHVAAIALMRHRTEAALRIIHARHRRLIESNIIGVVVFESGGHIREANERFLSVVGATRADLLSGGLNWCDMTSENWKAVDRKAMEELRRTGVTGSYEKEFNCKSGGQVTVRITAAKFNEEDICLGLVEDLTESKRNEARLRQSEKLAAIGQLAGGIAHDFNNQLGIILTCAEMLAGRSGDPEMRRLADAIAMAAQQSGDLTRNLLTFARQGHFESKPVDIGVLLVEVTDLLRRTLDKNIVIATQFEPGPAMIRGDATTLKNAFLNLAINARDAMPEGGKLSFLSDIVEREMDIEVADGENGMAGNGQGIRPHLHIAVADTGTGMTAEVKQKLFEPFFTTKAVGKGTGLGLASVHGTVKMHRGSLSVESELGKGACFHVYLPLADEVLGLNANSAARAAQAQRSQQGESQMDESLKSKLKLLLVEDEFWLRELTEEILRGAGYDVVAASGGSQALEEYQAHSMAFDLVLLDMAMPGMDGEQTFKALRAMHAKAKVLVVSGYSADGKIQSLLDAGAVGSLQKPYNRAQLEGAIAEALAKSSG
jgi:PAS domain S-box-containing protein